MNIKIYHYQPNNEANDDDGNDDSESEVDDEEKTNISIDQIQPKVQILIAERLARMRQAKQSSSMVDFNLKHKQKRSSKMEEKKRKKKQKSKIDKQLKRANVNNKNN